MRAALLPCLSLIAMLVSSRSHAGALDSIMGTMAKNFNYSAAFLDAHPPLTAHSWAYLDAMGWMKGRVWDEQRISKSFHAGLSYGQLRNLSRKVLAGEPLTILAYGDSVTAKYSGCYPVSQNTSASSHPLHWHAKSSRLEPWDSQLCHQMPNFAWALSFLSLLNYTYPSRQPHRYINFGSSASTIQSHAENDCQGDFLPDHVDLCIIEHFPMVEDPKRVKLFAETHLHRLWLHNNGPVPVVYLNLFGFSQGNRISNPTEAAIDNCLRDPGRWSASTTCSNDCDPKKLFEGEPKASNATEYAEMEVHRVARHYGLASWSHKDLIQSLLADKVHTSHNLTSCELFSQLYLDPFHPRDGGRILLADVLFHYVSTGIEHYQKEVLSSEGPIHNIGSPLVPESMLVPIIDCFLAKPMELIEGKVS